MKYVWVILVCILLTACTGQNPPGPEPEQEESEPKPGHYIDLTDDEIVALMDEMSPVILYFYSPTCATCHTVEPLVEELQAEYNVEIIWVSKKENEQIFEQYSVEYYPAVYIFADSEILLEFDENDSLTRLYSQILDKTISGMHRIDYTTEGDQVTISTATLLPDTLYYIDYDDERLFVFISTTAQLFVFSDSKTCDIDWLFLKKELIYNGQFPSQWDRQTLEPHGEMCGDLIHIPYTVTGSAIVISTEDIR
jgi:thiol-disulfide isomerase/thioredoxin